jgi:ABC-type phosphate/phosphonate transport system substrate-binding protein
MAKYLSTIARGSTTLDENIVTQVRDALLAGNNNPEMQAKLRAASLTDLVPVTTDHYMPIRSALAAVS